MKIKILGINKAFEEKGIFAPGEYGNLYPMGNKVFIKFENSGNMYPAEWFDWTEISVQKTINNPLYQRVKDILAMYSFDIKGYVKAILMILCLCLPFYFVGKMIWFECFQPAMAIFIFLSFINKKDK
jgi:hypothetical protein